MEGYQPVHLVELTSTCSDGSGTKLRDKGWALLFSRVAQGVRHRVGVGILINPWLGTGTMLEFTPVDKRVASPCLRVMRGQF